MSDTGLDDYKEYLTLHGHKVLEGPVPLFDSRPFIFQPLHPQAGKDFIIHDVYKQNWILLFRWFEPCKDKEAQISEMIAYPPYSLNNLSKKARNQTRRGLENHQVVRLSKTPEVFQEMKSIYYDNLDRLNLLKRAGARKKKWNRWVTTITNIESIQLWGAVNKDKTLCAFLTAIPKLEGFEIILHRSSLLCLPGYPNNALIYITLQSLFSHGARWVSYGLDPFWKAGENALHHFKTGMGFKAIALKERYAIHPGLGWLIKENHIHALVKFFRKLKKR